LNIKFANATTFGYLQIIGRTATSLRPILRDEGLGHRSQVLTLTQAETMQIAWGLVSLCLIAKQKTCFFSFDQFGIKNVLCTM